MARRPILETWSGIGRKDSCPTLVKKGASGMRPAVVERKNHARLEGDRNPSAIGPFLGLSFPTG